MLLRGCRFLLGLIVEQPEEGGEDLPGARDHRIREFGGHPPGPLEIDRAKRSLATFGRVQPIAEPVHFMLWRQ